MLNEMHIPTFVDTVSDNHQTGSAIITEGSLSEGFELPYMQLVVVTERELFKSKQKETEATENVNECRKNQIISRPKGR